MVSLAALVTFFRSSRIVFWSLLFLFSSSMLCIRLTLLSSNSFSSSITGRDLEVPKPYVSRSVDFVFGLRKDNVFHRIFFIKSSDLSMNLFIYVDFGVAVMFFVEKLNDIRSISY